MSISSILRLITVFILSIFIAVLSIGKATARAAEKPTNANRTLILDMVHHNPGEPHYKTAFNDPSYLKEAGYNGKVYYLFESPTLAITWNTLCKDVFPQGSPEREWLEDKVATIKKQQAACHAAGVSAYAMADLICFPKRMVEKEDIEKIFDDPTNPKTQELLRVQIDEMFAQFPNFDGLVVRIGETYLHDAPYHIGSIKDKTNPDKTIIPLLQLLREEVCARHDKQLVFRTWASFDTNLDDYIKVSDAVEPHKNLVFSVKHVEGDFHRANPFSKIIGQGRHRQIIEVQCAREYEGKGAYPNYIANGIIEGFEEHAHMPEEGISSLREFIQKKPELFGGIWTWSRGGGWNGPYITNEMWCTLNARVMAQWALNPSQSEEAIFNRYASECLNLKGKDIKRFRRLCLLSASAVVRGRNSTMGDMNPWWTRDQGIGWPGINKNPKSQARNLRQKDESLAMWDEIVELAKTINWSDEATRTYAIASSQYGRRLYGIYHALVYLADAKSKGDTSAMKQWIKAYDKAWESYSELAKIYPNLFTLYKKDFRRHMADNANEKVDETKANTPIATNYLMPFKAKNGEDARKWQSLVRERLLELVEAQEPRTPIEQMPIDFRLDGKPQDRGEYTLFSGSFQGNGKDHRRYPVFFTLPKSAKGAGQKQRFPAILCLHGHGGSREDIFRPDSIYRDMGDHFARGGYAVLVPSFPHKKYAAMMLWDLLRCIDILQSRPEVDPKRIGVAGLSMGGEWTMWLAACDARVQVAVVSGWMCTTKGILSLPNCACWRLPGFIEVLDVCEVNLLIAPRSLLFESAQQDECFPIEYCKKGFERIRQGYEVFGAADCVRHDVWPAKHIWHGEKAFLFVDEILGGNAARASLEHEKSFPKQGQKARAFRPGEFAEGCHSRLAQ